MSHSAGLFWASAHVTHKLATKCSEMLGMEQVLLRVSAPPSFGGQPPQPPPDTFMQAQTAAPAFVPATPINQVHACMWLLVPVHAGQVQAYENTASPALSRMCRTSCADKGIGHEQMVGAFGAHPPAVMGQAPSTAFGGGSGFSGELSFKLRVRCL